MKIEKITAGLTLLALGALLIAINLDLLDFRWQAVLRWWPLAIILWGLNLLLPRRGIGPILSVLFTTAAIAFLIYIGITDASDRREERVWSRNSRMIEGGNSVGQLYADSIGHALLNIQSGTADLVIGSSTKEYLFFAKSNSTFGPPQLRTQYPAGVDSTVDLRFLFGQRTRNPHGNRRRGPANVQIQLLEKPTWQIQLHMDGGNAQIDLGALRIAALDFDGRGATPLTLKLGTPIGDCPVRITGATSTARIDLPRSAACKIVADLDMAWQRFEGLTLQEDGSYQSEGYADAADRYTVWVSGNTTSLSVRRF